MMMTFLMVSVFIDGGKHNCCFSKSSFQAYITPTNIPKGELQEKQGWEDGGERHFIPHSVAAFSRST
jgi:hypothetical protein